MKNYAEIRFENQPLAEILHICEYGKYNLKLDTVEPAKSPKNAEDVLSMIFALLEKNPDTPEGRVYMGNCMEILHRTMLNLSEVINGFRAVEVIITTSKEDEGGNIIETKAVTNITISES
ncbi:MAG: hypothetical protein NC177_08160 [Ruminococcus flavefaciens]|nr:hypothetical protein [Ruminococcus flavefaciens]